MDEAADDLWMFYRACMAHRIEDMVAYKGAGAFGNRNRKTCIFKSGFHFPERQRGKVSVGSVFEDFLIMGLLPGVVLMRKSSTLTAVLSTVIPFLPAAKPSEITQSGFSFSIRFRICS